MTEPHALIERLEHTAKTIRDVETQAQQALENGDPATYKRLLKRKCQTLEELPQAVEAAVKALPTERRNEVAAQLDGYAQRAAQALELDSVFFMYALLYPESYQPGEPNDLEHFLHDLRASL